MSPAPFDQLLSDPYASRHYLVELSPYDLVAGAVVSLYYSDHGFTSGPADTPAHRHFDARVVEALNFQRSMFRQGAIGGASLPSFGEVRLDNSDGGLDFFRNLTFDGRQVVVRLGGKDFAYGDFGVIFHGTAHSAVVDEQQVTVRLRDLQYKLDAPLQVRLYAQPETGPDLAGRPKPLCFGKCLNVTPVQVNPAQLVYQVHDGPIQAIDAVYNRGVALAAGQYTVDLLRGTFTLLQAPGEGGVITADVRGDASGGYVSTVAGIARRVVTTYGPLTTTDLDTASFAALDAANPAVVGLYVTDQSTILQALDELVNSIGAFYGFDRSGKFETGLFTAPSPAQPAAATFGPVEILEIEALPTELPVWRQRVGYERNWTVQSGDTLAGAVTGARKAFLAEEMRLAVAADETVKTKFLLALDPEPLPTLLADQAAAQSEANRLLALYGQRREMYRVTVKTQPYKLELGDQIALDYTRFGLTNRRFRIVGLEERADVNRVTMELWG